MIEYDSAGIAVTVNSARWPYPLASISIDSVPITAIETREDVDAIPFFRIGGATRLPAGDVVVGDAGEVAVRVFSQSGAPLRRFSRFGHGPGELPSIEGVTHWGDTIVVFAGATRVAALFDATGNVLGQLRLQTAARDIGDVHRLSDGMWIGRGYLTIDEVPPASGYGRRVTPIVLLASDGSEAARLGTFPDAYTYTVVLKRTRDLTYVDDRPVPFSPQATFATDGESIYVGTGETYQIDVLDREGRTVRVVRRSWSAQEVTNRERAAFAGRVVEEIGSQQAEELGTLEWVNAHSRPHVPPYSRLLVDATGLLWVAEYPYSRREPRWWSVFDRDGRLLGDIEVPSDLAVLEIGVDYMLGVRRDDLGRESLYVYPLRRG